MSSQVYTAPESINTDGSVPVVASKEHGILHSTNLNKAHPVQATENTLREPRDNPVEGTQGYQVTEPHRNKAAAGAIRATEKVEAAGDKAILATEHAISAIGHAILHPFEKMGAKRHTKDTHGVVDAPLHDNVVDAPLATNLSGWESSAVAPEVARQWGQAIFPEGMFSKDLNSHAGWSTMDNRPAGWAHAHDLSQWESTPVKPEVAASWGQSVFPQGAMNKQAGWNQNNLTMNNNLNNNLSSWEQSAVRPEVAREWGQSVMPGRFSTQATHTTGKPTIGEKIKRKLGKHKTKKAAKKEGYSSPSSPSSSDEEHASIGKRTTKDKVHDMGEKIKHPIHPEKRDVQV